MQVRARRKDGMGPRLTRAVTTSAALTALLVCLCAPAYASGKTAIGSFGATPLTVASGGTVTLTASVSEATECSLSANQPVSGLPVSFACGTEKFAREVVMPQNMGSKAAKYKLTLAATGPGGVAKAKASVAVSPFVPEPVFAEANYHLGPCGFNRTVLMSADGTSGVWGRCALSLEGGEWKSGSMFLEEFENPVAIAPDGLTLVTSSYESGVKVYARSTEQEEWTLQSALLPQLKYASAEAALSANGNLLLVSRYTFSGEPLEELSAWERNGSTWESIPAPEETCNGPTVALSASGEIAMFGCYEKVQAFVRSGVGWAKQGPAFAGAGSEFGSETLALSADGSTAVTADQFANNDRGEVWFFQRTGETWTQQGPAVPEPKIKGVKPSGRFGAAAAISGDGNRVLVGAPAVLNLRRGEGHEPPPKYGAVFVFERSGETWTRVQRLRPFSPARGDEFGESVAMSENGQSALVARHGDLDPFGE